ncbi:MAG: hypothetical protein J6T87_10525 [Bacteroidales bacterium]|nr:hypothetical protein [Bacteroidales bacterium]
MKKLLALLLALLGFASTSCDRNEDYQCYYGTRVATFEEKETTDDYLSEMPSGQAMRDVDFVEECVEE